MEQGRNNMKNLTVRESFEIDELINYFYEEEIITKEERENLFNLKDELFESNELSFLEIKEIIRDTAYGV